MQQSAPALQTAGHACEQDQQGLPGQRVFIRFVHRMIRTLSQRSESVTFVCVTVRLRNIGGDSSVRVLLNAGLAGERNLHQSDFQGLAAVKRQILPDRYRCLWQTAGDIDDSVQAGTMKQLLTGIEDGSRPDA